MEKLYKDGGVHGANDNGGVEVTLCGLQAHYQGTLDHAKPPLNTPPTTTPPTPKNNNNNKNKNLQSKRAAQPQNVYRSDDPTGQNGITKFMDSPGFYP